MATTDRPRRRLLSARAASRGATPRTTAEHTTTVGWHDTDDGDVETPRRTMPVAHVLLVGIVALITGAVLNAPGIRKTALGQEVGWQRDVATFLADPLYDMSHAVLFDRPRAGLQEVIGRSGEDDIDLTLPSPTVDGSEIPEPPRRVFSPQDQAALYVTGDSLAITPGESVINQALANPSVGLLGIVDGHVATGLARPEVFNWPAYLTEVVARDRPDVVVLTIGSNDDQTMTGEGGGASFGTPAWEHEYRRRVGGLMDAVTANGEATLFWTGIPPMRNTERYDLRYRLINDVIRTEAERRPGRAVYVDTEAVLSPTGGGYADYLPNADGSVVQVRTGDGIHFTREGGDRIAAAVLKAMHRTFDLDSWKETTTTSTTGSRRGNP